MRARAQTAGRGAPPGRGAAPPAKRLIRIQWKEEELLSLLNIIPSSPPCSLSLYFYIHRKPQFSLSGKMKNGTGVNYLTWSRKYNFTVGDTLVFEYLKGEHNVYDVTDEAYRSCNETDGVYARYQSGNDTVELKKPKKYWFICNIPGHCFSGMRLKIDVYNKASSITSPPPPPPSPASNHSNKNWTLPLSTSFITALLILILFS